MSISHQQLPPNTLPQTRLSILQWINTSLNLSLTKIQQLGSGSIYCQLFDAAYPNIIQMYKVKWDAKLQIQFLNNFKILQCAFDDLGIKKNINIEKLIKLTYQDNLYFIQWVRKLIQNKIKSNSSYNPQKRRNNIPFNNTFVKKNKFSLCRITPQFFNKQNLQLSLNSSRYHSKTNKTMLSSTVLACKCSNTHHISDDKIKNSLKNHNQDHNNKHQPYQIHTRKRFNTMPDKRKSVGPLNTFNKNYITQIKDKFDVKDVEIIQSDGEQQDEFF